MATVKIVEYHCASCGKKLSARPKHDHCTLRGVSYGEPNEICKKCGAAYRHPYVTEAAQALTLSQRVPLWISSTHTVTLFAILTVACVSLGVEADVECFVGLLPIAALYLLLCALTRRCRQAHKNRVLLASRERMKQPEYFAQYVLQTIAAGGFTSKRLSLCREMALAQMNRDQPLNVPQLTSLLLDGQPKGEVQP